MFAEQQVQDAKSKAPVAVWMHPGTAPFASCGKGPVINFTTMNGFVFALTSDALYRLHANGNAEYLGRTSVSANGCSVDNNGTTICWCDGVSGWTWNTANGVRRITDPQWKPSNTVTYFDTYFVFEQVGTQQFYLSPPQWDGTDVPSSATPDKDWQWASKEATSDLVVAIANVHQQLFIFGEKRCEVWYDAGNSAPDFPLQRSFGALIQRGLLAPYTVVLEDNTAFFLGDDLVFYRLNGFVPERVSHHAIESKWQRYTGLEFTRAFSYTIFGHKMIALNFPAAKATWVIDLATKRWHERESWIGDNEDTSISRWRVNCALNNSSSTSEYPELIFGDSVTGRVDRVNNDVFTEFGDTMRALIVGFPFHSDRRRMFMRRFEIDVETGVGLPFSTQVVNEFCPTGITLTSPSFIQTPDALANTPASFSSFVFSNFVYLPDTGDGTVRGLNFGNNNLWITIQNDETGDPQISVGLWDSDGYTILDAEYEWSDWSHWTWVGISVDTATNQISCWINTTTVETALTPSSLTWYSTNPIPNDLGDPWLFQPV